VTAKHEAELKLLLQQIDEEKDKASDLEGKLAEKDQKIEQMQERINDLEATYKSQLADANVTIKDLQESRN
jgi:phage shock protein A